MYALEETLMFREAASAPALIAAQFKRNDALLAELAQRLLQKPPPFIVTCARGSSDHAATYGKYLFENALGLVTASAAPSLGSVYGVQPHLQGALYIAISQSGKSPDLLRNVELARAAGAIVVALVNAEDSPLAQLAETTIPLGAGAETSVAATKSYLCTMAALLQLTAHWSRDARLAQTVDTLPEALTLAWQQDWSPMTQGLIDARNVFVLGRGLGLGAAQEAALKLKETCALHAEAFSSAEVQHGPMTIVGPGFPVLCFAQNDATGAGMIAMAETFRARGARVFLAAPDASGTGALPLPSGFDPACTPLLTVASFYHAACELALARGLDPDCPPHLNKITETV